MVRDKWSDDYDGEEDDWEVSASEENEEEDDDFEEDGEEEKGVKTSKNSKSNKAVVGKPIIKAVKSAASSSGSSSKRTIEETYVKKTQLEHILLRPDTYIGSVEEQEHTSLWVLDGMGLNMEYRQVSHFVPGFYKIFDEILVNAADNKVRDPTGMTTIKVTINQEQNSISVYNDGKGIPIEIHKKEGIHVPELIFGHLLTSSNYNDNEKKVTGGRNGYGAKLANIFSTECKVIVETCDGRKKYKQTFKRNMSWASKPIISDVKGAAAADDDDDDVDDDAAPKKRKSTSGSAASKSYTKITFSPDLEKFGLTRMEDDLVHLLRKRVYDMAGVVHGVKVYLNNKMIKFKTFLDYVKFYINHTDAPPPKPPKRKKQVKQGDDGGNEEEDGDVVMIDDVSDRRTVTSLADNDDSQDEEDKGSISIAVAPKRKIVAHEKNDRWEVVCVASDGQFQQVSFVNSICTLKGGTHVNYITDQLVSKLQENLKKQLKIDTTSKASSSNILKPHTIKSQLWIFINCMIENPSFDSQTKENMTLKVSKFGSKMLLNDEFVKKVVKSEILSNIMQLVKAKEDKEMKKTDGSKKQRISGITKLDDANLAGTKQGKDCTLILTEGDSAKALAVSGLSVVGRDKYGVFPLRGKLLNVREAKSATIMNNEEISCIKRILGLQHQKVYHSVDSLRYGHVMIMADQDHDGSHIKGLILNLFDHFWPSLLKQPGFMLQFITPIVKVSKGAHREICFYTMPEYEQWKEENEDGRGWTIKYYKGLGTSTSADAKKYFTNMERHARPFQRCSDEDRGLLDLAFSKKKADERKDWLKTYEAGTFLDNQVSRISISEFVNKELILHSMADNVRSIPNVLDGFKPGHRKILFACIKRNLVKGELKVAQLAGYVSEHSAYHHGEASLAQTIILLAHDFVGSNNLNLLEPIGQFGTRLQGGKDNAAPRYIFTRLTELARKLFNPSDDCLLKYRNEDGLSIEPDWYIPIIPMVLVNGSEGIGTGWSTTILNYNPVDIVNNLLNKLKHGTDFSPLYPWYRGFKGRIERLTEDKFSIHGTYEKIDENTIDVTELPIGTWTQSYKEFLEELLAGTEKNPPLIKDYKEYHTETKVHFNIALLPGKLAQLEQANEVEKKLRLVTTKSSNLVLFDPASTLKKYGSVAEILSEFYTIRLDYYGKRKQWLESKLELELDKLDNKVRFLMAVVDGQVVVQNRKKAVVIADLRQRGFREFSAAKDRKRLNETHLEAAAPVGEDDEEDEEDEEEGEGNAGGAKSKGDGKGYDYLLSMSLWSLTEERIRKLVAEREEKRKELQLLKSKSKEDLWVADLEEFQEDWQSLEHTYKKKQELSATTKGKKGKALKIAKAPIASRKRDYDSEMEDFIVDDDSDFEAASTVVDRKRTKPRKSSDGSSKAGGGGGGGGNDKSSKSRLTPKESGSSTTVSFAQSVAVDKLYRPATVAVERKMFSLSNWLQKPSSAGDQSSESKLAAAAATTMATSSTKASTSDFSKKTGVVEEEEEDDDDDDDKDVVILSSTITKPKSSSITTTTTTSKISTSSTSKTTASSSLKSTTAVTKPVVKKSRKIDSSEEEESVDDDDVSSLDMSSSDDEESSSVSSSPDDDDDDENFDEKPVDKISKVVPSASKSSSTTKRASVARTPVVIISSDDEEDGDEKIAKKNVKPKPTPSIPTSTKSTSSSSAAVTRTSTTTTTTSASSSATKRKKTDGHDNHQAVDSQIFDVFSKSPDAAIKIKNIPCSISKDKGSASSNNRIKSIFDFDESGGEEEDDAGSDSEVILLHKKNKSAATQPPPVSSTRKRKVIHSSSDED